MPLALAPVSLSVASWGLAAVTMRSGHGDERVPCVPTRPKASEIERAWYVVDAEGLVLGRVATEVARVLRGKHKPIFAPHLDTGDFVIIVNADKVVLTAGKADTQAGAAATPATPAASRPAPTAEVLAAKPERGHAPHGRRACSRRTASARQMIKKLKVYAGPDHPHAAQKPQPLEIAHARRA